jgi:GTP pyrophosphokinase
LNTKLQSGDQVEIILGEEMMPRREWLFEHLGYASTSRARAKIRSWFGQREKQKNIEEGKKLLLDELMHLGIEQLDSSQLTRVADYDAPETLFAAIGAGDVEAHDVVEALTELLEVDVDRQQMNLELEEQTPGPTNAIVAGVGDLPWELASCCQPVAGDSIVGIMEADNLVHVHREDCLKALGVDAGRIIKVRWQHEVTRTFPVDVQVTAYDRAGLLFDITAILMEENTNVISINTVRDEREKHVVLEMVIEQSSLNRLLRTLEKIERLSNVISARRITSS